VPGRVVIFGWADSIHIRRWVQGLSERGWQIRLISLGGEPLEGIDTVNLPRRGKLSYLWHVSEAVRKAREFKPDLVHVHYAGGYGLWGARCDFAPLVVSVWGSDVVGLTHHPLRRMIVSRTLRKATRISATSDYLRRTCVSLLPEVSRKMCVIPFGVALPTHVSPMPDPPVSFCFIKLHRHVYGPDILLRAFAFARREMPDIRLTVVGTGDMSAQLERMVHTLDLEPSVKFVGLIPHERIYSLLQDHHIMVMPSREEAFGVAVLEAAACGRPTIASRVGGVPEVLRDGETGLLVPPGNKTALAQAMLRLARDPKTCRSLGETGRAMVQEKFLWSESLDSMSQLYESVIHRR
jgi:glycosyltransferase involved in cell wall biosynthesis